MNDEDYIRKAIELADGWRLLPGHWFATPFSKQESLPAVPPHILAALAAQLKQQVNATKTHFIVTHPLSSAIYVSHSSISEELISRAHSSDCIMNDIKVIVDSRVLEGQEYE